MQKEFDTYVITCNDAVMHVMIGTEAEANEKLKQLAVHEYNRHPQHWLSQMGQPIPDLYETAYEYMRHVQYWAARLTPLSLGEGLSVHKP